MNKNRRKTLKAAVFGSIIPVSLQAHASTTPVKVSDIRSYAHSYSYFPGDWVDVRCNVNESRGNSVVLLQGEFSFQWKLKNIVSQYVSASGGASISQRYPVKPSNEDQSFPVCFRFQIPSNAEVGVYNVEISADGSSSVAIPVYVRRRKSLPKSDLLVVIPINTRNAYSNYGGKSVYGFNSTNGVPAIDVSFRRPFDDYKTADFQDLMSWIENRYSVDYVTDIELHKEADLLTGYKCVVLVKHNEYYSMEMREHLRLYQLAGGNIANLAANSIWFRVEYLENGTLMRTKAWSSKYFWELGRSTRFILGNHFEGAGSLVPPRQIGTAYNTQHWMYDGTSVRDGDSIGDIEGVADFEVDGVDLQWTGANQTGQPLIRANRGYHPSYVILSVSLLKQWNVKNTTLNWTVGIFDTDNGGQVFNAATVNWSHAFKERNANNVPIIDSPLPVMTKNFLDAVVNDQLIEFKSSNPMQVSGKSVGVNGQMYIYLKKSELLNVPQQRLNGRLKIRLHGFEWIETMVRLTFPTGSREGVVPLYKHTRFFNVPRNGFKVYKEVLSPSAIAPAGWVSSKDVYVFAYPSTDAKGRNLFLFTDIRVPGVGQRMHVRPDQLPGERVGIFAYKVC